jgi:hypothetical protein
VQDSREHKSRPPSEMSSAWRAVLTKMRFRFLDLLERAVPRSIVGWFVICWCAFLLGSIVLGMLLLSLYSQSTTELLRRASAAIAHGCDAIAGHYQFFVAGTTRVPDDLREPELARGLTGVVKIGLRGLPGVEGGIWQMEPLPMPSCRALPRDDRNASGNGQGPGSPSAAG